MAGELAVLNLCRYADTMQALAKPRRAREAGGINVEPRAPIDRPRSAAPKSSPLSDDDGPL
jgi:hypothetical protein